MAKFLARRGVRPVYGSTPPLLRSLSAGCLRYRLSCQGYIAIEGRAGDAQVLADLRQGEVPVCRQRVRYPDLGRIRWERTAAPVLAPGPGRRQPGPGAFLNQPPLELRQRRKNTEDELAGCCRCVQRASTQR